MTAPIEIFKKLCTIPHGSGNEKGVADWLEAFAAERGLGFYRDSEDNVLITKPGKGKGVILQGHSDMVCEKNEGVDHDFERDGLELIEGEKHTLTANGTTLGADDGISIAVMLSILEDPTVTLPLECLVTSKEEIGLLGMTAFDFSRLKGRAMINLDSMDEAVATVSCCGGVRSDIDLPAVRSAAAGNGYTLKLRGLRGGHSGEDIDRGRKNAILTALMLLGEVEGVRIADIEGGSKDNAIPRECTLTFVTGDKDAEAKIADAAARVRETLTEDDGDFSAVLESAEVKEAFGEDLTAHLRSVAKDIPFGVIKMNEDIPGLVHTSANLAAVHTTEEGISVTISSRSPDESVIDSLVANIDRVSAVCGGEAKHRARYPGWDFAKDSPLRELYLSTYDGLFGELGKKARYEGIHAGLECGLVKAAIPDMDIISIGADIKFCHSPDETLDTASLDRLYLTVREMLKRLGE